MKRKQIENFIIFINVMIKMYYNNVHKFINVFKRNMIYLRLHYEYKISRFNNHKLHNQRIDLFKILKKIKKLTYRLKFSSIMRIYSIISIV